MSARIGASSASTSCSNPSISARATFVGTDVTRPSQYDDSCGVSTGTGTMTGRRPTSSPNCRISSSYVSTSGPPAS